MDVPESYTTRDITKRIIVPSINKLLKLKEFHFLRYKYSYKGKKVVRVIFTWHPETIPSKKSSTVSTSEINDDLDVLLRGKQIREGEFFKEKDQEEIIPGMPGYKFAEEEDTNKIGEDDLPF